VDEGCGGWVECDDLRVSFATPDIRNQLTLTTGLVPAKRASTLPHQRSLHQLKPHPPTASSSVVVGEIETASAFAASEDPAGTSDGI
jgi:hypothetical protein